MDNTHKQRAEDSANRTWCKPVSRETVLGRVKAFHEAMHDAKTLATSHCRVCYQQRAPKELEESTWEKMRVMYTAVEDEISTADRDHFACQECFPRDDGSSFLVCTECHTHLSKERLPPACRVNNLSLGCDHRYPNELRDLSPLEERLIGIYIPNGWITKITIEIETPTSGKYRKHIKGHITVLPNDVKGIAADVLPHALVDEKEWIHICFVGPRKPEPRDLGFMLRVRPQRLKCALVWLKKHNPLFREVAISEENLRTWADCAEHTEVSQQLFDSMKAYDQRAEDLIRTGHYVPATERGLPEEPIRDAAEVIASLEEREQDGARMEEETNTRIGGIAARGREPEDMDPRHITEEISEITSTGLLSTEETGDMPLPQKLAMLRKAAGEEDGRWRGRKPDGASERYTVVGTGETPYIVSRRGEEFADSNDPDFFPKAFPCLFPWGRGGPKALPQEAGKGRSQGRDFHLRKWTKLLLQRHGGQFATHPTFSFLIFNILVRSENRRVSYVRMNKAVFPKIQEIVKNLTTEAIQEAVEELSATRTTTNPDIQLLLRETNAFGKRQHMSNEERLFSRRKIQSLCVQFGMPCVWYTINPNDLTNPVNMKLATFRVARSEAERTKLFADFKRNFGGRVQHVVKDAVSSAQFFHREIELFFKHLVAVGEESIFGKVSSYFGCIETNERGALHIHGLLWLDANMELPKLFDDLEADKTGTYAAQSCDVQRAMSYRRFDSVFSDIVDITQDMVKFAEDFDNEVNMVVHRCQMHSCGATCTKYSYKDKERRKGGKRSLCRFHAPWCLRCKTEITPEGILHIRRNHERINRFSAALAVALRHNHNVAFLPTNAAGLAMIYYATNYSTKLDNPLWKRVALMSIVLEGIAKQE
ncbi:hypothetical protein CSOJ01_15909, partial [Colletotrichum sojae]